MSLIVTKDKCTLSVKLPEACCSGLNRETSKFVVVVDDVETGFRIVTTPLTAHALSLHVAIPPYFSSSADRLAVTVHLCQSTTSQTGWMSMKTLTAYVSSSYDYDEELAWLLDQYDCEHGPTGKLMIFLKVWSVVNCEMSTTAYLTNIAAQGNGKMERVLKPPYPFLRGES